MKRLQLPKNKFARLGINIFIIVFWFFLSANLWSHLDNYALDNNYALFEFMTEFYIGTIPLLYLILFLIPSFFISRFIWFEKSRNRTFYGIFDKLKRLKKLEPRIYTTTSNADELKKYSELKDQGIITEEEFQAKKKKLLDL